MPTAQLVHLGRMPYGEAWALQQAIGARVRSGEWADTVLLVEHPPVYTLGRGAHGSRANLIWDEEERRRQGIELFEVDRGGDITYHGPGQLVGYPILNLNQYGRDLHQYLRNLEEALIRVLRDFGVGAGRLAPHTGVWVGEEKIAAIGVKASHWITQHGFALNVDPNLAHFTGIIPCGIEDKGVTSMSRVLSRPLTAVEVTPSVEHHLAEVFGFDFRPVAGDSLMSALAT